MAISPKQQVSTLPLKPGVYLFKDAKQTVLYVGKAIRLRSRVRSYFTESADLEPSKKLMVKRIIAIDRIITDTEEEALQLEANLIKRHRPPYNIVMRDDKSFLFIKVDMNEPYPRVDLVRRPTQKKGVKLFGPYTSATSLRSTLRYLKRIFPYRTCKNKVDNPCFDASIHRCLGHDAGPGSEKAYRDILNQMMRFLRGQREGVTKTLKQQMDAESRKKHYEKAAVYRDRLKHVERIFADQKMLNLWGKNHDVISFERNRFAAMNVFIVREGKLIDKKNILLDHVHDRTNADILYSFMSQYYAIAADIPKTILTQEEPTDIRALKRLTKATIIVPQRGQKRKLITLGITNARDFLKRQELALERDETKALRALKELARILKLPAPPKRIEIFDISNIQGSSAVGSMVVFENGLTKRDAYRKFRIQRKRTPDDVAMMKEMLDRRLKRTSEKAKTQWPRPDLMIVDGGKGQLGAARAALREAALSIPVIALAKREEEVYVHARSSPIKLPSRSEALTLLQRMRDEAHRSAISYFRSTHERKTTQSILDDIPGIGPKTKKLLLKQFGSVDGICKAQTKDLVASIGKQKTTILQEHLP